MEMVKEYYWMTPLVVGMIFMAITFIRFVLWDNREHPRPKRPKMTPWRKLDSRGKKMRIAWFIATAIAILGLSLKVLHVSGPLADILGWYFMIMGGLMLVALTRLESFFGLVRYVEDTGDTSVLDNLVDGFGRPYTN